MQFWRLMELLLAAGLFTAAAMVLLRLQQPDYSESEEERRAQ